jgi:hypothetical protein
MGLALSDRASHDRLRPASCVAARLHREHLVDETGTAGRLNSTRLYGSDPAATGTFRPTKGNLPRVDLPTCGG